MLGLRHRNSGAKTPGFRHEEEAPLLFFLVVCLTDLTGTSQHRKLVAVNRRQSAGLARCVNRWLVL
jgi:hypothetical protein